MSPTPPRAPGQPARRALLAAAGALALVAGPAGCLLPADSDYVPPPANVPPRLVDPSPSPTNGFIDQGPGCPAQDYGAKVVDSDYNETIYWRVFVDYQMRNAQIVDYGEVTNQAPAVPIGPFHTDSNTAWVGGDAVPHVVELVVSDRPFEPTDQAPLGHATEGETDSIFWTIRYTYCTP